MRAMIMAAGLGERMRPISERRPKPLLPVLGRPLIDYVIDQLRAVSIREIGINIHHLAFRIAAHLSREENRTLELVFSHEQVIRGTGGGMAGLRDFLSGPEPFIVHNGDVFSTIPLQEVLDFHKQKAPLVTMVLVDNPRINTVTVTPEGIVTDISGHHSACRIGIDRSLTFTGISVVDPAVLDRIPDTLHSNIIDTYLPLIESKPGSICGYVPQHHYWIDVGTPAAYLQIHRDILLEGKASALFPPQERAGIHCAPGASIDPSASLAGFISLGENSRIEAAASLQDCIIWEDTTIAANMHVSQGVLHDAWQYQIPT